ncbi:hypothetical protein QN277_005160 [Acacia crassicarpa]|uniref:Calmodulin-binding protein n=1 Tax=Acacia crassicarpa TaxID=499986 RepID=A0AAE1MG37_9FABA|nr:hypothetical protein QN277_005160 [Acacia crassicarpa]
MEVQVVAPSPAPDSFNFDSNCSSPYITAPSSPQRFAHNFYFSAPTSPTRSPSPFFLNVVDDDDDLPRNSSASSSSSVPFLWEEKPGVPKSKPTNSTEQDNNDATGNEDFEFNFSGLLDRTPLTADELFDGGKIRPLKLPPRLHTGDGNSSPTAAANSNQSSPRSRISQGKRIVQEAFSPRHKKRDFDPFAAAMEEARKSEESWRENHKNRGRERISRANSGRKGSRSLSPLRVSDIMGDSVSEEVSQTGKGVSSSTSYSKPSTPTSSLFSFSKGYRKWRLKDFLLFRSASEGRATDKDPLRKYTILSKKTGEEDAKTSSFRSSEGSSKGGGSTSSRRRGAAVSAHELHYTVNRAAAEEMKKKTYLPYKQGLLGCLGFNPGMHGISRGIGSFARP